MILFFFLLPTAFGWNAQDLKTGDVLVQSVPCYVCSLIELEEEAPYSHAGLVQVSHDASVSVLEALGKIEKISLPVFLSKRKANTKTLVLRPVSASGRSVKIDSEALLSYFQMHFYGRHYDEAFLWNNYDELGEKYYCSELVAKLLNAFLPTPLIPKAMHFTHYRKDWINYFHGTPPDGQPGLAPSDFIKSPLFRSMGTLE